MGFVVPELLPLELHKLGLTGTLSLKIYFCDSVSPHVNLNVGFLRGFLTIFINSQVLKSVKQTYETEWSVGIVLRTRLNKTQCLLQIYDLEKLQNCILN